MDFLTTLLGLLNMTLWAALVMTHIKAVSLNREVRMLMGDVRALLDSAKVRDQIGREMAAMQKAIHDPE